MSRTAKLELDGKSYELPIVEGTEKQLAIDISSLRAQTGYITLDDGYGNTGSCSSAITFIDGDKGILRYRGIPIEEIAGKSSFVETAWLVMFGHLPTVDDRERFSKLLTENSRLDPRASSASTTRTSATSKRRPRGSCPRCGRSPRRHTRPPLASRSSTRATT